MDLIAISRPGPGPVKLTCTCLIPKSKAFLRALSVTICTVKGADFLDPLKPHKPADDHKITLPLKSVIDIRV